MRGYLALNTLRNRIAHNLDADVSATDVPGLVAALGPYTRDMFDMTAKHVTLTDWLKSLRVVLLVLLRAVERQRESEAAHWVQVREASKRVQTWMQERLERT